MIQFRHWILFAILIGYFSTFQLEYFFQSVLIYALISTFQTFMFIYQSSKSSVVPIHEDGNQYFNQAIDYFLYHELDLYSFDVTMIHFLSMMIDFGFLMLAYIACGFQWLPFMQVFLIAWIMWIDCTSKTKFLHSKDIDWLYHELHMRWSKFSNHEKLVWSNIAFLPGIVYACTHHWKHHLLEILSIVCTCIVSLLYHYHHECKYVILDRIMAIFMIGVLGYEFINEQFSNKIFDYIVILSLSIAVYCLTYKTPYALWHSRWHFAIGISYFLFIFNF